MRMADIEITPRADGPILWVKIGGLKIRLSFTHEQARRLCVGILGEDGGACYAAVQVAPLLLPKGIRRIDEDVLHAREVTQ